MVAKVNGLRHPYGLLARLLPGLEELSPAYFALVMSTGILSVASFRLGLPVTAHALFALNIAFYVVLWTLFVLRLLYFPRAMMADIADHLRGPGFFTVVVATSVLGSQVLLLGGNLVLALVLWGLAILLWIGLTYAIFTILTVKRSKPPLERGINGGWLLAVVATQSVAVLGALLAAHVGQPWKLEMNFFALSMWLWGGMLYIWMMSLIFYRYAFFTFEPGDLSPPYWINMGAMAISTLAGALLIANVAHAPFLLSLQPFIKGFTVFYWATGTWWIPMLLVLALWRHVYRRFPLRYYPLYWGAVFPLGMYAAATHAMFGALGFAFLGWLPWVFLVLGLGAWMGAFVGMLRATSRALSGARQPSP